MKKLKLFLFSMFLTLNLFSQDDFSLTYNPFNNGITIDSTSCYYPEKYYMDVPVVFSMYDNSKDVYVLKEGLVVYQSYYNVNCKEETYWDIIQFVDNYYKEFNKITYDILGFRIITNLTYKDVR